MIDPSHVIVHRRPWPGARKAEAAVQAFGGGCGAAHLQSMLLQISDISAHGYQKNFV
jgi:hypothetical protein